MIKLVCRKTLRFNSPLNVFGSITNTPNEPNYVAVLKDLTELEKQRFLQGRWENLKSEVHPSLSDTEIREIRKNSPNYSASLKNLLIAAKQREGRL